MNILIYIIMCFPAVLMSVIGFAICSEKKDATMTSHHFARNFNIRKYDKRVKMLFVFTGILFSVGGIILVNGKIFAGIAVTLAALIIFIFSFIIIQKNH